MESPLVKALSQASGDGATPEQMVDESPAVAEGELLADPDELQLMDSTQVLAADDEAAESEFAETAKLSTDQPANEDAEAGVRDVSLDSATAASTLANRLWIRRLGTFSPIICVVLAVAAAAGHLGYQTLGGWNQNADLRALSNQARTSSNSGEFSVTSIGAKQSPFKLVVGASSSSPPRSMSPATATGKPPATRPVAAGKPRAVAVSINAVSIDDKAYVALNEAFDAYERGDYEQSESAYRRALALAPRHPNALHGLAAILHRTGRFDESRQFYESLLSVDPGNTAAAAALLTGGNQHVRAANESEIKQLIQRHPNSAGLQFALGQLMAKQQRWPDARDRFANAVRLDRGNADYLFNLAISLDHLGRYSEARPVYESALASSDATSTLNSDLIVARLQSLAAQTTAENDTQ